MLTGIFLWIITTAVSLPLIATAVWPDPEMALNAYSISMSMIPFPKPSQTNQLDRDVPLERTQLEIYKRARQQRREFLWGTNLSYDVLDMMVKEFGRVSAVLSRNVTTLVTIASFRIWQEKYERNSVDPGFKSHVNVIRFNGWVYIDWLPFSKKIQFGLLSAQETVKISELEVTHRDLYTATDRLPVKDGVLDQRLVSFVSMSYE